MNLKDVYPLPWELDKGRIIAANGTIVAMLSPGKLSKTIPNETIEALGKYIVKAANNYPELQKHMKTS